MHEMSLAERVVQIIEEQASQQAFRRVREIRLEIGRLAGVEVEALRFALEVVSRGTLADGARITIIDKAGEGWCLSCAAVVPLAARFDPCPHCGGYGVQPTVGTEMRVKELDVE
ncbi:MAG: hydrogenase maturation nickel metallochaperone HypA [Pseudomonadota bacterium]